MIIHYNIKNIPKNKFVVFYMGEKKIFYEFDNVELFINFYIPFKHKHFYEVIREEYRKIIIDIDIPLSIDVINNIANYVKDLIFYCSGIICEPVLFSTSINKYHIVIPNFYFHVSISKYIVNCIDPYNNFIDKCIYKNVQFIRLEGSSKFEKNYCKYVYGTSAISVKFINHLISTGPGILVNGQIKTRIYKGINNNQNIYNIPPHFRIRYQYKTYILLDRLFPAYCKICKRQHDKENAYMIYNDNNGWNMYCFRSKK
jgi:hypothetical protein